ncbi:jerky protein homolog-like [Leptopilina boulardi]|uniref:jerky protein homolog-like n=1 Tax=Leptopilina boulardi TaxID=63433 RepID=UPI0021F5A4C7|nr:jerky protein homolog-like [Leptopilina boulardi]
MSGSTDKHLDSTLITWFQQIRDRGDPISEPILKEKALLLSQHLNPASNFKTLALSTEAEVSGRKEHKERITALFCSNAQGSHRIPILVVGKSCTSRCLKNLVTPAMKENRLKYFESLGVIYTHQNSSWMDRQIFMLWYKQIFIPFVKEHQKQTGVAGIVTLILDNAPSHPSEKELNAVDKIFNVQFLPPNVTAKAWEILDESRLHKVWRSILGDSFINDQNRSTASNNKGLESSTTPVNEELSNQQEFSDQNHFNDNGLQASATPLEKESLNFPEGFGERIVNIFTNSYFSIHESRKHLLQWLHEDEKDDCGWEPMTDEMIIKLVTTGIVETTNIANEVEETNKSENLQTKISHSQALESLQLLKTYMENKCESEFHAEQRL